MGKYRYEMGGIIRDTEIDFPYYTDEIIELLDEKDQRIAELEEQLNSAEVGERFALKCCAEAREQLKNAIVPKFKVGDCFIEYWNKEPNIYQYQGNSHFKCLNKNQGYHCDYVILGALLLDEDFIQQISKEEAQAKLKELKGENK